MSNRAAVAWLALALFVGALIAGFVPVHANGVSCGAAFSSGDKNAAVVAQFGDDLTDIYAGRQPDNLDYAAACDDRRSTQRTIVVPLLVIGALTGGFLALTTRKAETEDQVSRAA